MSFRTRLTGDKVYGFDEGHFKDLYIGGDPKNGTTGTQLTEASIAEMNTLNGLTATATELNYLDITTLGTGAASKAIVLDASGDYTFPASATIVMPSGGTFTFSSGSTLNVAGTFQVGGVTVTSDAAELNILDGVLATAAEINRAADMSTRVVNCTASTLAVTEADHDGKFIVLDRAAGIDVTLPVPVAGMSFEFYVKTTFTGAATIKSTAGTQIMVGHAIMGNDSDNTTVRWPALASDTFDTIDMYGTANSTGGIEGQTIKIRGLSSTLWHVEIIGDAAGTEATPFANTVA
jgi:hypothetical protein